MLEADPLVLVQCLHSTVDDVPFDGGGTDVGIFVDEVHEDAGIVTATVTVWLLTSVTVVVCHTVDGGPTAGHDVVGSAAPQSLALSVMAKHLVCPKLGDTYTLYSVSVAGQAKKLGEP
jgi:hypothetical protein